VSVRFAIVGAGAIGAYAGAALARGGCQVTLIARGEHLEAMQRNGVEVRSPRGDFHAHPEATDELAAIAETEVVFVTLKAYSLPELMPRIVEHLAPGAVVMSGQNGIPWWYFESHGGALDGRHLESVDPGGVIQRNLGVGRTVGSVVYPATEIIAPGVIRHVEGTRFSIGEPDRTTSERCERISEAFKAAGLKCPIDENLRAQIWLKLLGNASFNPVSALTRATLGELGEVAETVEVLRAMMEEMAEVAGALDVEMPVGIDRRLERGLAVGDHKTSMLQDIEAGKPLEHACMSGAVVELATLLDMRVPHMQAVDEAIAALDEARR
jgi:2-dehydropantoate 2-reductase